MDAVVAINMIHIARWEVTIGLMAGAGATLAEGDALYLYGTFREDGAHAAPSNAALDDSLRARDASWGIRDIEAVAAAAQAHDLHLAERVVVYRRGVGTSIAVLQC